MESVETESAEEKKKEKSPVWWWNRTENGGSRFRGERLRHSTGRKRKRMRKREMVGKK